MEFDCDLGNFFGKSPVVCLTSEFVRSVDLSKFPQLHDVIHYMGAMSAQSQSLMVPVTTYESFGESDDQKLYFLWDRDESDRQKSFVLGMCKVGQKLLYLHEDGNLHRYAARCLLDFYIYHSCQRSGKGKKLLEAVLKSENLPATALAIDRPSLALLSFMRKQFDLSDPHWHSNSFVTFPQFFQHYIPSGSDKNPIREYKSTGSQLSKQL